MRNPMDGGEVAYLRHAEVGVEENPGTLRCALHTGLWKSAVALRRESANRPCVDVYNRSSAVFRLWRNPMGDGGRWGEATAEGRLYNRSPRLACLPGVGC